ncbi:MAG TPA: response regulator transcription factor [Gemmatimonadaceae bacterium]|nr:response regulator transcription factor [Gemmatimonadaceae bacterium]
MTASRAAAPSPRPRLIIADDHHMMVEALRGVLAREHEIVGVAHTADAILETVARVEADVLLLDLSLPGKNGLELMPDIGRLAPALRIIVVTMHLDRVVAETALRSGASGFVPKDADLSELAQAISAVMTGGTYMSPRVPPSSNRMALKADHAALAQLTPRQHEIMGLIADGRTSAEIAQQLGLSERTVAFHRTNIRAKLGVDSEHGLMRYALLMRLEGGA